MTLPAATTFRWYDLRVNRRIRHFVVLFLLSIAAEAAAAELKWESEWSAAFTRARKEQRPVFVDFYATWCVPCRFMDEKVFPVPAVAERLNRFVLLRIDGNKKQRFTLMQGVRGYPTYIIYDPSKYARFRLTGTRSPEVMAEVLDLYLGAMPAIMRASDAYTKRPAPEPLIDIGRAYLDVGLLEEAKVEFERALKMAKREGPKATAQLAQGQLLMTRALGGEARHVVAELEAIAGAPESPGNALFAWMAVARSRQMLGDRAAMNEALARASALASDARAKRAIAEAAKSWESHPGVTQK
jgi:thioredoxin-like negative regulator of GroEL